jgi:cytochrome c-type biogenesis protein
LLGFAFAFGWTPCIGPVLGSILTVSASSGADGIALLAIYSAGLGVPFILLALFTNEIATRLKRIGTAGRWLYRVAGALMVLMGLAIMTGQINKMAFWLLETFPALGLIG